MFSVRLSFHTQQGGTPSASHNTSTGHMTFWGYPISICPIWGFLHLILLSLVPCPFWGVPLSVTGRGYPCPRWGGGSPAMTGLGTPCPGQDWVPPVQDRIGYLIQDTGQDGVSPSFWDRLCLDRSRRKMSMHFAVSRKEDCLVQGDYIELFETLKYVRVGHFWEGKTNY